ncbi:VOC family protein [Amycolatopsis sp.]|uniref:VOC family protein n=1 Tax=Amycolatopsis sp. TaxID=37632 RepID=UPI002CB80C5F|nr:VOC family protein [Amycolatopsis sp.]HVV08174.1 VOC family protein [Amycolatopsis sp.]
MSASAPQHAHSVMHCNLNTVDGARAAGFVMALFGLDPRMRSVSTDDDSTSMGMGKSTASVTTFCYDRRGPRAVPAVEFVDWRRPVTQPAEAGMRPSAFVALGYRVASLSRLEDRLTTLGLTGEPAAGGLRVRGAARPGLTITDPDGVTIEVVEIPPAGTDPAGGLISHERVRCSDLARSLAWYGSIGWTERARGIDDGVPWASLVLPEDPTFSLELEERAGSGDGAPRRANTQGLYRIALAVEDVREAHAALVRESGVPVPEPLFIPMPDTPTGGFTVLFLADPDGAVVELVERPRSEVRRPLEPR